ncbi:dTDP-glucose 4,6-dehydratase [Telmatospirillum sp. J64-1]|uniref:dTDP-glucose 4,6-dehydratase n=1 Tax=Telmatospirillum sp. J64-1 TaxID=2502183 RepID=UPI00115C81EE|nr:dTDP-glucose 4,6-dehydratase [Telmatospirillum sp. J64-1]
MAVALVTGGSGFIGSATVRRLLGSTSWTIINLDALTYAAQPASLADMTDNPRYVFEHADILDAETVEAIFQQYRPDYVLHLAAESHVDRSIDDPGQFIRTNVTGTFTLLEAARRHWQKLPDDRRRDFRFLHVSTDEVFGSLGAEGKFSETSQYQPNSPYSASKAGADHLVRAWGQTYGLPVIISNCSNNYGPRQFPEKLIPLTILKALRDEPLPVYGKGENIRDWLFVEDHAEALHLILERGKPGGSYMVGGDCERRNIEVVTALCDLMDEMAPPLPRGKSRRSLITFVTDRPGHDARYAADIGKISRELGWQPRHGFADGLKRTVRWYLDNADWWQPILDGSYNRNAPAERLSRLGQLETSR